ncbi:MAG: M56 family metallopeptidase [Muribaculaceae bacterium]|nr:M56 family metallopeptidase [Muribaculaceae bacterium]
MIDYSMIQIFQFSLALSLSLAILWLIYRLILADTKNFMLNRASLLMIYVVSFVCPLISDSFDMGGSGDDKTVTAGTLYLHNDTLIRTIDYLSIIWISGASICFLLTMSGFIRIMILKNRSEKAGYEGHTVYLSDKKIAPFSFGNLILMSRSDLEDNPEMILLHERGHISNRHTFDLLFAQTVVIMCWYNPVAWLMRQELKTVHEYQADDYVLGKGCDAKKYQLFLINRTVSSSFSSIANYLNYSQIRKRISMMNSPLEIKSKIKPRYAALLAGIVCAIFLLSSSPVRSMIKPFQPSVSNSSTKENSEGINMDIYVDGNKVANSELNTIPSSEIKAITVNKKKNRIEIEMDNSKQAE